MDFPAPVTAGVDAGEAASAQSLAAGTAVAAAAASECTKVLRRMIMTRLYL
jgi:hypothetical protein